MKPCISQATTMSTPLEADLPAFSRCGWTAVELWLTKLEAALQHQPIDAIRELMASHGLVPAAAAGQGGLLLSTGLERETHWSHFQRRLGILRQLGVSTLVLAADFVREPSIDDYARAANALGEAGKTAEQFGLRIALEFQKGSNFCASLDTALALVAGCGSGNVGVCLDLLHYQTGPSKYEDFAYLTTENLAWVQACDLSGTPRELAGDSDRIFPGEGDIQLAPIVDHLRHIGYDGYVSLELLNPRLWQVPADQVASLGLQALERVLRTSDREPANAGGGA
jgi:sugar phosphate isomerase/epimerase